MALYYNFAFAAKEEQPIWMVKLLVEGMKQQLRSLYPGGRGYPSSFSRRVFSRSSLRTQAEEDTPVPSPGVALPLPAPCRRVFSRSSLRTFPSSGFRSLGFRPRLFDSALSAEDPLRTALRHVVRCDEYKPSRRRSRPTSPGSVHRSASSTTRSLYDGLNRRRVGLSTTSASGAAAALRLCGPRSSQVSGAIPFSSILSRCLSILAKRAAGSDPGLCLRPTLILYSFRRSLT